ncbi:DUF1493 family protein [Chitinophaga rhizophila]|uniref:DUF1493 family protein n=1 Tax=Chitinophaga rhizophila TaxID=2866212 RepID=A0ABS7GKZ9_9BACT|nr:DUF1493 family protein [Chitinophaga rhizophila]MBW8688404.1 DUF1493 family protein [Chitinophaga rhizophila]
MRKDTQISELIAYISLKCGGIDLTEESIIFDDLGINGIDAATLMEDLANEFDFSLDSFDYGKYFLSESELSNIFRSIFYVLFKRDKLPSKTFNIKHLKRVVDSGRWFDPE